jgi:hypothetical protein
MRGVAACIRTGHLPKELKIIIVSSVPSIAIDDTHTHTHTDTRAVDAGERIRIVSWTINTGDTIGKGDKCRRTTQIRGLSNWQVKRRAPGSIPWKSRIFMAKLGLWKGFPPSPSIFGLSPVNSSFHHCFKSVYLSSVGGSEGLSEASSLQWHSHTTTEIKSFEI